MPKFDYDLFVIGGGSGGVRSARLAAGLKQAMTLHLLKLCVGADSVADLRAWTKMRRARGAG